MKLEDLIRKLQEKPQQKEDVKFVVYTAQGEIVCCELEGKATMEVMRAIAKTAPPPKKHQPEAASPRRSVKAGAPKLEAEPPMPTVTPEVLPPGALTPAWKKRPEPTVDAPQPLAPEPADLGSLFAEDPEPSPHKTFD